MVKIPKAENVLMKKAQVKVKFNNLAFLFFLLNSDFTFARHIRVGLRPAARQILRPTQSRFSSERQSDC